MAPATTVLRAALRDLELYRGLVVELRDATLAYATAGDTYYPELRARMDNAYVSIIETKPEPYDNTEALAVLDALDALAGAP